MLASAPAINSAQDHRYRMKWLGFVGILYFFFNSAFLPHGLLYTTILAPLFYLWMLKMRVRWVLSKFMLFAMPIALCQLIINSEINLFYFARSFVLYLLVFVVVYAFIIVCRRVPSEYFGRVFEKIIYLNFIFSVGALFIKWTPLSNLLWTSASFEETLRLKLLTYEPSYYSTMMVPLVVFALYRYIYRIGPHHRRNLLLVLIPVMLSLSFGVISGLLLALGLTMLVKGREMLKKPSVMVFIIASCIAFVGIIGTDNYLSNRLDNVVSGSDSSGAVRFFQSNYVAWKVAEKTSFVVGSGFGQAKDLAVEFFDEFWLSLNVDRLTNVVAATLAEFGFVGVVLRFSLEWYLFIRTRVPQSQFRMTLFWFAFIYQFTGSYTTNLAEYVIWVLAFIPVFNEFENRKFGMRRKKTSVIVQTILIPR